MKKFRFVVPIRGSVEMEVEAKDEAEAREKIRESRGVSEGFPTIDTWYISKAFLEEERY